MVLLYSLVIVAISSLSGLMLLAWCVQYATSWLLPPAKDAGVSLPPHNPKPYHARG